MVDEERNQKFSYSGWKYHPDREAIIAEPHARPALGVTPTDTILYVGFTCDNAVLFKFFEKFGDSASLREKRHDVFEHKSALLKIEQHTEFVSLTILLRQDQAESEILTILNDVLPKEGITLVVQTRIVMCKSIALLVKRMSGGQRMFGGTMRGKLEVRSSLLPDEKGTIVYLVHSSAGSSDEIGRRIQRLIEMETYRTMALLGLTLARRAGTEISQAEIRLKNMVLEMNAVQENDENRLFDLLSTLSQDCNTLQTDTRFRFSASKAYYAITQQRLSSLEEEKFGDLQTITGFVLSRLDPSMATIDSAAARLSTLIGDLGRALSLLRTRIDLDMAKDNQLLLKSMDERHHQQVLIAQTVEGLSAVAITYYSIGLLGYVIKSFDLYLPVSPTTATAIAVPVVLVGVWMFLRKMRSKWHS